MRGRFPHFRRRQPAFGLIEDQRRAHNHAAELDTLQRLAAARRLAPVALVDRSAHEFCLVG